MRAKWMSDPLIGVAITVSAALLVIFVVMQIVVSNEDFPPGTDYVTALTRYLELGGGALVLVVVGLTLIGSMMRAAAHGRATERGRLDFAGKLFAVAAATVSVAVALYAAPWFPSTSHWITIVLGPAAMIIFGVILIRQDAGVRDAEQR